MTIIESHTVLVLLEAPSNPYFNCNTINSNRLNFDLNKSRQKFHRSFKEHHQISNIPKFRCEILEIADNIALRSLPFFSHFVLQTGN
jgi:hypothetical protein